LDFSVIVGSQAKGEASPASDWDIAIQWSYSMPLEQQLANTEHLRHRLAHALGVEHNKIDLINAPTAKLAMKACIANEGVELTGAASLEWRHFLQRTWRELEDYYWDELYIA